MKRLRTLKKINHPYYKWEDWQSGMYLSEVLISDLQNKISKAKSLLINIAEFSEVMGKIIKEWSFACEENLTDIAMNRQAWLGQAACCYKHSISESVTRLAWRNLTKEQQDNANKAADKVIIEFENKYRNGKDQLTMFQET